MAKVKISFQIEEEQRNLFKNMDFGEQSIILRNLINCYFHYAKPDPEMANRMVKGGFVKLVDNFELKKR